MTREQIGSTIMLYPAEGGYLTNGETFSEAVYLGKNADESAWRDATAEEYEAWLVAQEEIVEEFTDESNAQEILDIILGN